MRGTSRAGARWGAASAPAPRFETPIVPASFDRRARLVAVVAIMTFLASLTTGAVMLVRSAASEWQSDVAREVTIQIRSAAGRDIEADVARAAAIARVPGVAERAALFQGGVGAAARAMARQRLQLDDLPVPRVIVVRIAPGPRPISRNCAALAERGAGREPRRPSRLGRSHARMAARRRRRHRRAPARLHRHRAVGDFRHRGAMATNRPIIEVLHLIGAKDNFIAGQFQRHFLQLGLKGGLIGGGSAIAAVCARRARADGSAAGARRRTSLRPCSAVSRSAPVGYLAVLAQVVLIAGVTA